MKNVYMSESHVRKNKKFGKVEWKRARLRCTEMWKKMAVVNVDENESCSCGWK